MLSASQTSHPNRVAVSSDAGLFHQFSKLPPMPWGEAKARIEWLTSVVLSASPASPSLAPVLAWTADLTCLATRADQSINQINGGLW